MNVGSGKYNSYDPSCTYKGKTVPYLVKFSEGGGIAGHILTNVLRHLDDLKFYDNGRESSIIPALLVDVHVSCFDMKVLKYICDENHKWTVFLVFLMGNYCDR